MSLNDILNGFMGAVMPKVDVTSGFMGAVMPKIGVIETKKAATTLMSSLPSSISPNISILGGDMPLSNPTVSPTVYLPFGGNNNQQPLSNVQPYIIMPGGYGGSNQSTSTGIDSNMLLLVGGVALLLGGAYFVTRKKR